MELEKVAREEMEARLCSTDDSLLGLHITTIPGKGRGITVCSSP